MKYSSDVKPSLREFLTGNSINSPAGFAKIPLMPIIWSNTDQFPLDLESTIMKAESWGPNCFFTKTESLDLVVFQISIALDFISYSVSNPSSYNLLFSSISLSASSIIWGFSLGNFKSVMLQEIPETVATWNPRSLILSKNSIVSSSPYSSQISDSIVLKSGLFRVLFTYL